MKKYLLMLIVFMFFGCADTQRRTSNSYLMNTKQVSFERKDNMYFLYSTYVGKFCEDEWYKVLGDISFKNVKNPDRKCNLKHYFILELFDQFGDISAISVNKTNAKFYTIEEAKIVKKLASNTSYNKVYLVLSEPFLGAKAFIEILLDSGQFVSLNQQILSKSLFFHQVDLNK